MENSLSPTPRINCGIWTTLELLINKENSEKIWDRGDNWLRPVPKKKDKPKSRFDLIAHSFNKAKATN